MRKQNSCKYLNLQEFFLRGAGGNRTRVQTRKQYAFYMLIPRLNFRIKAGSGPPTFTLAS
jgi:hypothetical protein